MCNIAFAVCIGIANINWEEALRDRVENQEDVGPATEWKQSSRVRCGHGIPGKMLQNVTQKCYRENKQ